MACSYTGYSACFCHDGEQMKGFLLFPVTFSIKLVIHYRRQIPRAMTGMSDQEQTEVFVQLLAESQGRLFGYVYSMLGDHARAMDVVQETNLVLWRKKAEFRAGAAFMPWAVAIARFQVLAHVRDQSRERCLLDSELVAALSEETEKQVDKLDSMRVALRQCLDNLPTEKLEMIQLRYYRSMSIAEIAQVVGSQSTAVKVALLRLRRSLAECMHHRMLES